MNTQKGSNRTFKATVAVVAVLLLTLGIFAGVFLTGSFFSGSGSVTQNNYEEDGDGRTVPGALTAAADGWFEIRTVADLNTMATMVNTGGFHARNFRLMANITFTGTAAQRQMPQPIGIRTRSFTGVFDGQGFSITGLHINETNNNIPVAMHDRGLFGHIASGIVRRIHLVDTTININLQSWPDNVSLYVGVLVGQVSGSSLLSSIRITNAVSTVVGGWAAGGSLGSWFMFGQLAGLTDGIGLRIMDVSITGGTTDARHTSATQGNLRIDVGGLIGYSRRGIKERISVIDHTITAHTVSQSGAVTLGGLVGTTDGGRGEAVPPTFRNIRSRVNINFHANARLTVVGALFGDFRSDSIRTPTVVQNVVASGTVTPIASLPFTPGGFASNMGNATLAAGNHTITNVFIANTLGTNWMRGNAAAGANNTISANSGFFPLTTLAATGAGSAWIRLNENNGNRDQNWYWPVNAVDRPDNLPVLLGHGSFQGTFRPFEVTGVAISSLPAARTASTPATTGGQTLEQLRNSLAITFTVAGAAVLPERAGMAGRPVLTLQRRDFGVAEWTTLSGAAAHTHLPGIYRVLVNVFTNNTHTMQLPEAQRASGEFIVRQHLSNIRMGGTGDLTFTYSGVNRSISEALGGRFLEFQIGDSANWLPISALPLSPEPTVQLWFRRTPGVGDWTQLTDAANQVFNAGEYQLRVPVFTRTEHGSTAVLISTNTIIVTPISVDLAIGSQSLNRPFNGNTTFQLTNFTLGVYYNWTGAGAVLAGNHNLRMTAADGTFNNLNVADANTVTFSNVVLAVDDGVGRHAANFTVTGLQLPGSISPAMVTMSPVAGTNPLSRAFNGTANTPVLFSQWQRDIHFRWTGPGAAAADSVHLRPASGAGSGTASFASMNVGTGIAIDVFNPVWDVNVGVWENFIPSTNMYADITRATLTMNRMAASPWVHQFNNAAPTVPAWADLIEGVHFRWYGPNADLARSFGLTTTGNRAITFPSINAGDAFFVVESGVGDAHFTAGSNNFEITPWGGTWGNTFLVVITPAPVTLISNSPNGLNRVFNGGNGMAVGAMFGDWVVGTHFMFSTAPGSAGMLAQSAGLRPLSGTAEFEFGTVGEQGINILAGAQWQTPNFGVASNFAITNQIRATVSPLSIGIVQGTVPIRREFNGSHLVGMMPLAGQWGFSPAVPVGWEPVVDWGTLFFVNAANANEINIGTWDIRSSGMQLINPAGRNDVVDQFTFTGIQGVFRGEIYAKRLTLVPNVSNFVRVFNGLNTLTAQDLGFSSWGPVGATQGVFRVDGVIGAHNVLINWAGVTAQFNQSNAGTNIPLTFSGITLLAGHPDNANYIIDATFVTTGTISPMTVSLWLTQSYERPFSWNNPADVSANVPITAIQVRGRSLGGGNYETVGLVGAVFQFNQASPGHAPNGTLLLRLVGGALGVGGSGYAGNYVLGWSGSPQFVPVNLTAGVRIEITPPPNDPDEDLIAIGGPGVLVFGDVGADMTLAQVMASFRFEIETDAGRIDVAVLGILGNLDIRMQRWNALTGQWNTVTNTRDAGYYRLYLATDFAWNNLVLLRGGIAGSEFEVERRLLRVEEHTTNRIRKIFDGTTGVTVTSGYLNLVDPTGRAITAGVGLDLSVLNAEFATADAGINHWVSLHGLRLLNVPAASNYRLEATPGEILMVRGDITRARAAVYATTDVIMLFDQGNRDATAVVGNNWVVLGVETGFGREVLGLSGTPIFRFEDGLVGMSKALWLEAGVLQSGFGANAGNAANYYFHAPAGIDAGVLRVAVSNVNAAGEDFVFAIVATNFLTPRFEGSVPMDRVYGDTDNPPTLSAIINGLGIVFAGRNDAGQPVALTVDNLTGVLSFGLRFRPFGGTTWVTLPGVNPNTLNAGEYYVVINNFGNNDPGTWQMHLPEHLRRSEIFRVNRRVVDIINGGVPIRREVNEALGRRFLLQDGNLAVNTLQVLPGDVVNIIWNAAGTEAWFGSDFGVSNMIITGIVLDNANYVAGNVFVTGEITNVVLRLQVGAGNDIPNLTMVYHASDRFGAPGEVFDNGSQGMFGNAFTIVGNFTGTVRVEFDIRFSTSDVTDSADVILHNFRGISDGGYMWEFVPLLFRFRGIITPRPLNVEWNGEVVTRQFDSTYGLNMPADEVVRRFLNMEGLVGNDRVGIVLGAGSRFDRAFVGETAVRIEIVGLTGAHNYSFSLPMVIQADGEITARVVEIVSNRVPMPVRYFNNTYGFDISVGELNSMLTFDDFSRGMGVAIVGLLTAPRFEELVGGHWQPVADAGVRTLVIRPVLSAAGGLADNFVLPEIRIQGRIDQARITVIAPQVFLFTEDSEDGTHGRPVIGADMWIVTGNVSAQVRGLDSPAAAGFGFSTTATHLRHYDITVNREFLIRENPNYNIEFVDGRVWVNRRWLEASFGGLTVRATRARGFEAGMSMEIRGIARGQSAFSGVEFRGVRNADVYVLEFRMGGELVENVGLVSFEWHLSQSQIGFRELGVYISEGGVTREANPEVTAGVARLEATNLRQFMLFDVEGRTWIGNNWVLLVIIGAVSGALILLLIFMLLLMAARRRRRDEVAAVEKKMLALMPGRAGQLMLPGTVGGGMMVPMATVGGRASAPGRAPYGYAHGRPTAPGRGYAPGYAPQRPPAGRPPVQVRNGVKVGPNGQPIREAKVVRQGPVGSRPAPGTRPPHGTPGSKPAPGTKPPGSGASKPQGTPQE